MQTIYLDISNKGVVPIVYAKQNEVGRKFLAVLTDSGIPYAPPAGSVFSAWYDGDSGDGNYTDIGEKSAFVVNGNKIEVELISQMISVPGEGVLCLVLNLADGSQIASWNIKYEVEPVPGADSEQAVSYYTAFSRAVENLPYPDTSLSVSGKAADAAAVGNEIKKITPAQIGAAPLTNTLTRRGNLTGGSNWDNAYEVGLYEVNTWTGSGGVGVPPIKTVGHLIVYSWASSVPLADQFVVQELHSYENPNCVLRRISKLSTYTEWEWENPPMVPGVEYRTTERYNGKAVYIREINCGSVSATGITRIPCEISWGNVVDYNVLYTKQGVAHKDTLYKDGLNVAFVFWEYSNICIFSGNSDVSNFKVYVTVKYMKN